jgi:hypothetical protein
MKLIRTLVLIALAALSLSAQDFYLKSGDTVVFYGDSITDQRLYTTFAETYAVTRFPTPAGAAIEYPAAAEDPSTCGSSATSSSISPPS